MYKHTVCYSEGLDWSGWIYRIYMDSNLISESNEYFESYSRANFAAVGHITLLERLIKPCLNA